MKKIYIALISGMIISGIGILGALFGEWGRDASSLDWLAMIGLYLNLYHAAFYVHIFGDLYTDSEAINILLIFIVSSIDWIIISYLLIQAVSFIKKKIESNKTNSFRDVLSNEEE